MASLVEFQDFNLPHHSVIMPTIHEMQTLEEIMAQDVVQPLPTPPLSPDHMCPSPSSESSHDLDSGDSMDITEALLNEMMQYEQLFVDMEDDHSLFGNGQTSFSLEGNFLVQDCMWNSHTYKPRNTINLGASGLYTPAPSPPPPQLPAAEQSDQAEAEDELPTANNDLSSESSSSSDQTDCISPNDVFPMLLPKNETVKKSKSQPTRHTRQERTRRAIEREQRTGRGERSSIMTRRSSANTTGNSRIQPQASSSASSESGK